MTCLDYVIENLTQNEGKKLKEILTNGEFFRNKSLIRKGDIVIFTHGYHVGFGRLAEYYDLETDEYSNGEKHHRVLSLYDDRLKIAIVNPKIKKGSEILCQKSRT